MKKFILMALLLVCTITNTYSAPKDPLNRDLKNLFQGFQGQIIKNLNSEIESRFSNFEINRDFKILNAKIVTTNILNHPLEIVEFSPNRIIAGIPTKKRWNLYLRAKIRYKTKLLRMTKVIKLNLKELSFKYQLDYYLDENNIINVTSVKAIDKKIIIQAKASNIILSGLLKAASDVFRNKITRSFEELLAQGATQLKQQFEFDERFRRATPSHLKFSPNYTYEDLATTIENIEDKISKYHFQNGTVLNLIYDTKDPISWFDAYGPNGIGTRGKVIGFGTYGDCAIWNGAYLASQAFRFAVNQSPKAMNNIKRSLGGIENLLGVNGFSGLLSRSAQPVNSPAGQSLLKQKKPYDYDIVDYKGEKWISLHEKKGITRDQYTGVIFGLSITYDVIDDPQIKKKAAHLYKMMLDYIIKNNWKISEDREISITPEEVIVPTVWFGNGEQQINMLLIGEHMFPGRYKDELEKYKDITKSLYLFHNLTAKDNINKYYKFNLLHMHFYNYFRLEKDTERRNDMLETYKTIKHSIGNHDNSFFNLIEYSFNPSGVSEENIERIQGNLLRFLERSPRDIIITRPPLDKIDILEYPEFGGSGFMKVSADPLDVRHRHLTGSFMWQRDPNQIGYFNQGSGRDEDPGYAMTLIYWMSKYHGL